MKTLIHSKDGKTGRRILTSLLCAFAVHLSAFAQLTVVVTPGHTFRENERPTVTTLNQLGKPTIQVYGTIGGTNVSLGTNSILGEHLSDSVVDNFTIEFDNSVAPRRIRVKAFNIGTNVVSSNLAGDALIGGDGDPLSVFYDTNWFRLDTNGALSLQTNVDLTLLSLKLLDSHIFIGDTNDQAMSLALDASVFNVETNVNPAGALTLRSFTSFEYPLAIGTVQTNHGFTATPSQVRWVLLCKTNDIGYVVGDEVDAHVAENGDTTAMATGANATNVFLAIRNISALKFPTKDGATQGTINSARWKAKAYCRP